MTFILAIIAAFLIGLTLGWIVAIKVENWLDKQ